MPKPLTVVFCLPGSSFSGRFLECWTELVSFCLSNNIRPVLSRRQSCNIYFVRNMCLGADVSRGKDQKPFDGKLDYDYLMWIDSDCLFSPEHFERLLNHGKDIMSGVYLMEGGQAFASVREWDMEGGQAFASVREWDEEYFKKNKCFQFMTPTDLQGKTDPLEVSYTGMGFMLVKKGVLESMEYPWFRPIEKRIGDMVDFTMEDVGFCLTAKERRYTIWIDPQCRVGHEKRVVL